MNPVYQMHLLGRRLTSVALILFVMALASASAADAPKRLKRADSFLGIHFDFHAGPDCKEIGKNTTPEMVENIIDLVKPDYLQIDCKGHRGLTSYPTKVGNQAPGFVGDPLRIWRDVTAKRGVALYMHYSGVWDSEAIIRNPSWGAINADGKTNGNATSFFSPYADKLLIPQLRELAGEYGVDGVWVDGECWASVPDYGAAAVKAFQAKTGVATVPRKPSDPNWYEWLQFNRELFRQYLRHYIAEVKKTNPEFQLCSNWAYTDHMPEAVNAPLDFLSGDYSPEDSVNSARISARYLARQGVPWDLMAWSFTRQKGKGGANQKPAVQLQREAAVVLALGGGFQAYYKQKRDGSIYSEQMPVMAEVAKFCRERQAICHHATQVPQIALLYSTAAHYRKVNGLFPRDLNRMSGALQALLHNQHSVELLGEHHLSGRLQEYPLVMIPEWDYLDEPFKAELLRYVNGGGNLVLIGPKTAALFANGTGRDFRGAAGKQVRRSFRITKERPRWLGSRRRSNWRPTRNRSGRWWIRRTPASRRHRLPQLGKGKIAGIYFTFGQGYTQSHNPVMRDFLNDLVRQLFPNPMVKVKGSRDVDVMVNTMGEKLAINLVNTGGPHESEPIIDSIAPVGPLEITIRSDKRRPSKVTLEPGARPLAFAYAAGDIQVTVPKVDIHEILVVE